MEPFDLLKPYFNLFFNLCALGEKYINHKEELINHFEKLPDEKLLELYANPEPLKEIGEDLNYSFGTVFSFFHYYIINNKLNPKQKNIYDYYIEKNSIFEYPTPRILNAIRLHFKNNLNENIDDLTDNEILATIYIVSLDNKRKKKLKKDLTTININTLSDMLDHKLIHETFELREKYYVNVDFVKNSIKTEFKNRTVTIRSFLSELDINDLLKFFLSHKTLQYCSDFNLYDEKKINNLNEKRIANLSEEFGIPICIIKKLVALEFNSRIKYLEKTLNEYKVEEFFGVPSNTSNTSLASNCHLNEKIVANYIKNQNEKSSNSVSCPSSSLEAESIHSLFACFSRFLEAEKTNLFSKIIFEQNVAQVLKFCNSLKKEVILNLPKEYSNAASHIINICDKYKSDKPENKILRIIEIFKTTNPIPSNYNTFFNEVLKNFPSLKDENPNFGKINLEFIISDLLNCDNFDLIANSLDLSLEQFKNVCLYIINLKAEAENEILNFCIINMDTKNLNFQDYNSFVEFFSDLFKSFPNILQSENNKNETEIIETHESNNIEPKPELEIDEKSQEK